MKLNAAILISVIAGFFICSCQNEEKIEFSRYYTAGSLIYQNYCQNCHGQNGEGLSALIPPVTDSVYLHASRSKLPCFVKSGLKGLIKINHKIYDDQMPPQDLTPIEIAEVLTYITNSFGNKLGVVNEQEVSVNLAACK